MLCKYRHPSRTYFLHFAVLDDGWDNEARVRADGIDADGSAKPSEHELAGVITPGYCREHEGAHGTEKKTNRVG
jgi:hypothetical protein